MVLIYNIDTRQPKTNIIHTEVGFNDRFIKWEWFKTNMGIKIAYMNPEIRTSNWKYSQLG